MKISIAMAVYNGTNYLDEQLASFLNQTRLPQELVVVDDCSTDRTIEVIRRFAATAPFQVRILKNEFNSGSTVSFERAISQCKGDLIFPSDHDDIWGSEKIKLLTREFEANPHLGLVWGNAELIDELSHPIGRWKFDSHFCKDIKSNISNGKFVERTLRGNVVGGATSAFRASYKRYILPIPKLVGMIHDGWIALIVGSVAKVDFLPDGYIKYRQHNRQQIGAPGDYVGAEALGRGHFFSSAIKELEDRKNTISEFGKRLQTIKKTEADNQYLRVALHTVEVQKAELPFAITHLRVRQSLPNAASRIMPVIQEAILGRYNKYSNGFRSIARDLLYK